MVLQHIPILAEFSYSGLDLLTCYFNLGQFIFTFVIHESSGACKWVFLDVIHNGVAACENFLDYKKMSIELIHIKIRKANQKGLKVFSIPILTSKKQ